MILDDRIMSEIRDNLIIVPAKSAQNRFFRRSQHCPISKAQ